MGRFPILMQLWYDGVMFCLGSSRSEGLLLISGIYCGCLIAAGQVKSMDLLLDVVASFVGGIRWVVHLSLFTLDTVFLGLIKCGGLLH